MKIPSQRHYALIHKTTIYIPGDERSRTNPGHGYPESYEESFSYQDYSDKDLLTIRVNQLITSRKKIGIDFWVLDVIPMSIETKVELK